MAQLGRAFIEVHADTRPFGRELKGEIDAYLAAAQAQVKAGGEKMGQDFGKGFGTEAKKGLGEVSKEFEKFGNEAEKSTRRTGRRVRTELKKGLDAAEKDTRNWASRMLSYFTSWALNSVSNFQGFASGASKALEGVMGSAGTFVAIFLAIAAAIIALIPLIDALVGVLGIAGVGAFIGLLIAMSPVLLVFKEMSKILPVLTGSTKKFNAGLKDLNPALRPLAVALRAIALAVKNLPLGKFVEEIVPPLQIMAKFFNSKPFRTAFKQLAEDAGQLLGFLLLIFETPAVGRAFFTFLKTIGTLMAILENVVLVVGQTLADVFNDPGVQAAIIIFVKQIADLVILFANWLDRAAKDGSLDKFLNSALQITDDIWAILSQVAALFAVLGTPENLKSLHEFLSFVATTLSEIVAYFKTDEGRKFMHRLYITLILVWTLLVTVLAVLALISLAWSGIEAAAKLAWLGTKSAAVATLQTIINYINTVIGALNKAIDLLNWFGLQISHIPKIPNLGGGGKGGSGGKLPGGGGTGHQDAPPAPILSHGLADGAIVTDPMLTMVGERSRPEVVIPLTQPNRARQLADQSGLTSMLHQSNRITVQVDLDGKPFYEYTARAFDAVGQSLATGPRS